ncbi:protein of unknown function [Candidatus Hydrogenisulfobacillus filiaventi]|uniref:NADH-quinone oxidoreductase subunit K n=1 Tax=Candidatus Hydrogenisulfobacillus filiaventi TaxID=2707344 RepID=A0A6F8ZJ01_9FIRM|nr:NADH-quinone oxidoreductase subunit K [Bacillota bacterium]CAB1129859.1 protein of unknown function [Candidatus Hydrogenisulfobacillus filiaventi]
MFIAPGILALVGVLVILRYRHAVLAFMGLEIVLAAANWAILAAAQAFAGGAQVAGLLLFAIPLGAAEAAIGLTVVLRLAARHHTIDLTTFARLGERRKAPTVPAASSASAPVRSASGESA